MSYGCRFPVGTAGQLRMGNRLLAGARLSSLERRRQQVSGWTPSNWAFPVMSFSKAYLQDYDVSAGNAADHLRYICYILLDALKVTPRRGEGSK